MKILVVSQYYNPEPFRIHEICAALSAKGHEVTVLTSLPNYPEGRIYPEFRWFRRRRELRDGVNIFRVWQLRRGRGKFRLALNYASFVLSGSLRALFFFNKFDTVLVYEISPITMAIPALMYKFLRKTPVRLYCMDLWPESLKTVGIKEQSKIYAVVGKISSWIYRNCDTTIVASAPFIKHLEDKQKMPRENLTYIPQHAENLFLRVSEKPPNEEPVRLLFAGNMGYLQNIDCILEAVAQVKSKRPFVVDFVGTGSYLDEAQHLTKKLLIENRVVFHGRHPLETMLDFYQNAHAFLLTLRDDNVIGLTLPGKLQSYMAAARPILGSIGGAAADIIKESQCGRCVSPGDATALAEMIDDFLERGKDWTSYGLNGRRFFVDNFTLDIFIQKLTDAL